MNRKVSQFNKSSIQGLKPETKRYEAFDGTGLGMRVSPKGTKSWICVYHFQGEPRFETIGRYPSMGVGEARARVAAIKIALGKNEDPRGNVAEKCTVKELADRYIEKHAKLKKATWDEDERILQKDVLPQIGRRQARTISRKDIVAVLDAVQGRGSGVMANRTLAVMRKMFNFAAEREIVDDSPCRGVKAPTRETSRQEVLSMQDIRTLWHGLDEVEMDGTIADALRLALLTGQRIGEVVALRWIDIDVDERTWTIPAEDTKNGRIHRVPLSGPALEVLERRREHPTAVVWAFPSPRGDSHLRSESPGQALRAVRDDIGLPNCRAHDLRRTLATHIGRQEGVDRVLVSKILNHTDRTVTAIYDRYERDDEKREALEEWGRRVLEVVNAEE